MRYGSKGFGLIEMLMVLLILGALTAIAYEGFLFQAEAYRQQNRRTGRQQALRAALEAVGRDLRLAGYPDGASVKKMLERDWFPIGYFPSWAAGVPVRESVTIFPGGAVPDRLLLLAVLPGETNPAVLRDAADIGATALYLALTAGEVNDQYRPGDVLFIGRPPEFARVVRVVGRVLEIDADPDRPGQQGLERSHPPGTELGELSLVSYAVYNAAPDPPGTASATGRPVLKRKVNAGGFEPLVEDVVRLRIRHQGRGNFELLVGALAEPDSPKTPAQVGPVLELATRVANRNP